MPGVRKNWDQPLGPIGPTYFIIMLLLTTAFLGLLVREIYVLRNGDQVVVMSVYFIAIILISSLLGIREVGSIAWNFIRRRRLDK